MRRLKGFVKLATIVFALVSSAIGARAQAVAPGSHVRIVHVSKGNRAEGSFVTMTADSLTYRPGLATSMVTISMDSVAAVDVSDGFHTRPGHILRGAAIGTGVGIGVAVLYTAADCMGHPHGSGGYPCETDLWLGVPLGAVGFLAGAIFGHEHKSENWQRIYERSKTTSLLIGPRPRGGFAIGFSMPFGGGSAQP